MTLVKMTAATARAARAGPAEPDVPGLMTMSLAASPPYRLRWLRGILRRPATLLDVAARLRPQWTNQKGADNDFA